MSYPNNVAAVYTHDFADREVTLVYAQSGGSQPPPIVSNAAYEPFGCSTVSFGSGRPLPPLAFESDAGQRPHGNTPRKGTKAPQHPAEIFATPA